MEFKANIPAVLCFLTLTCVSCKKQEIVYYEIPKEPTVSVDSAGMPEGHPSIPSNESGSSSMGSLPGFSAPTQQTELAWIAPEEWVAGSASSVRIGSFALEGLSKSELDISITRFPGDVGGLFSNVNRWRRQLSLPPITDPGEVEKNALMISNEHFEFRVFKMSNEADPALASEVGVLDLNGFTWFFKLTGFKKNVEEEAARFEAFLRSVQPGEVQS